MGKRQHIQVGDWTLSVDSDEVRRIYKKVWFGDCQCDNCTNWSLTRERFVPHEAQTLLESLGLHLDCSGAGWQDDEFDDLEPGFYRVQKRYVIPGEIVSDGTSHSAYVDDRSRLTISNDQAQVTAIRRQCELPTFACPCLVVSLEVDLPWLPGEMQSFTSEQRDVYCPQCGLSRFAVVGRLTNTSRIPSWFGVELRLPPQDYIVSFCTSCVSIVWQHEPL